jgi:multisubunit Na+/H+ antiporter MnhG subunit
MNREEKKNQEARDTGLAVVLISIIVIFFVRDKDKLLLIPAVLLLVTMAAPQIFRLLAPWWFRVSKILGHIASAVLLSLVFILVATPVGLIRRILGADPMQLKRWKKDKDSVFTSRNHTYISENLERPF